MEKRLSAALAAVTVFIALMAAPAGAHVTANPGEVTAGGFAKVAFRVPNERPDAGTVKLEVKMPEDHPIGHVTVRSVPGWEVDVAMRTLPEPIDVFGEEVTEVVDVITWSGGEIAPGQFEEFEVSMGPLPEDAEVLYFPTIQTYGGEDAEEVAWIEETPPGGEEPERPAPMVRLTAPTEGADDAPPDEEGADPSDGDQAATAAGAGSAGVEASVADAEDRADEARTYAAVAVALAVVAAAVAAWALLGRRRAGGSTPD